MQPYLRSAVHQEKHEELHMKPLARFTVLDLTRVRSGPAAVRQFADWGANVIKIEEPSTAADDKPGGSAQFADYQNTHRNKKSISLNLKHPKGKALFLELVKQADVIVENYRPSVKFKLGIDYESLRKVNRASSTPACRASGRMAPMQTVRGWIRSPRVSAGSCQ